MHSIFGRFIVRNNLHHVNLLAQIRWRFIAIALLSLHAMAANAQSPMPITLLEAEDLALAAEPGRQELEARADALQARAVAAGELPDPELRVGMNNFPFESGGFTTEGMTNAALGIRQVFPAGATRTISSRQYQYFADEMGENAETRGRNVLTAVRVAWLDLYYWNEVHGLVTSSRPYFDDLATVTRSMYSVGRKSQQDVLRAQLELSRLDDRVIEIERQRSRAQFMLSEWVGNNASRPVAEKFPAWEQIPRREELQASLLQHPLLRASESQIAARDAGVELANERSKSDWSVDLGYSYRDGLLPSGQSRSDFVSVNVTVGLPFFRKRAVDATLTAALQERTAAQAARQKMARELHSKLATEHARWTDLSRRLALYEASILHQAAAHAEASMLAYQSDKGDFSDVMRAYVDELDTRVEYARLRVERAQSYAALANLGGIAR